MCVREEKSQRHERGLRRAEPGIVIAVNESDEAAATGGTLDCSGVICRDGKQMKPSSGFIRRRPSNSLVKKAHRTTISFQNVPYTKSAPAYLFNFKFQFQLNYVD